MLFNGIQSRYNMCHKSDKIAPNHEKLPNDSRIGVLFCLGHKPYKRVQLFAAKEKKLNRFINNFRCQIFINI